MNLRRLTPDGIAAFSVYLDHLKADPALAPPSYLRDDVASSESVTEIEVPDCIFATRFEAAAALDALVTAAGLPSAERDAGLWAWLALFYFDQLCPVKAGMRSVGERARYIPQIDIARRYYRHMLLGPASLYRAHSDKPQRLLALLSNPLSVATSETYRLFIENPSLIACKAVIDVATLLYFDFSRGKLKRGAGSKASGGTRRLIDYLQQIDCTFDLPTLSEKRLMGMLPREFQGFIPRELELINASI